MNIVVAMKQAPDLQQVRIRDRQPVLDDVVFTFGSLDKNALETAAQLKAPGDRVFALCVGNAELEDTVKEALAAGADEAYLVADDVYDGVDSRQAALLLASAVREIGDVQLLVCGEGSGDNYSGQVVGRVAELLGWPQVGFVQGITVDGGVLVAVRSLDDVLETVSAPLPAVVSVTADINEVRIPAVTEILRAGRKPKTVVEAADAGVSLPDPSLSVLSRLAPENNRQSERLTSVQDVLSVMKSKHLI